jgi:hypothetical protein
MIKANKRVCITGCLRSQYHVFFLSQDYFLGPARRGFRDESFSVRVCLFGVLKSLSHRDRAMNNSEES